MFNREIGCLLHKL